MTLTERASVLDLLIHIVYGISCTHLAPSFETVEAVLDALIKYGISPPQSACPDQPLYQLLLLHAPHRPIDAYALAGQHGLEDAAVAISAHLLAYDSSQLSDALVSKMGPVYLRRLLCLHQNRLSALKTIVLRPPEGHPPTPTCGEEAPERAELAEAWAFAVAQLVWDVSPGECSSAPPTPIPVLMIAPAISTNALRRMFEYAGESSVCSKCRAMLQARIGEVCKAWAAVKVRASVPRVAVLPSADFPPIL